MRTGWLWGLGLRVWFGAAAVTMATPALGQAPAEPAPILIVRFEDIAPKLPPPDARKWDPMPLVEAIAKSDFTFTPKHYFALLDAHVHPEVVRIVATRAGVFHDPNALALDDLAARARQGAGSGATQVPIAAGQFVEVLEFFNDRKNEIAEAEARIGVLRPRSNSESDSAFEKRERTHLEKLAQARGPAEGRIDATTFLLDLPAAVVDHGGCKRSVATVDLSAYSLDLFRATTGSTATNAPIAVQSPSIESARFTLETPKRFEVVGRCGTTATKLRMSIHRTWDGKWSGTGGL